MADKRIRPASPFSFSSDITITSDSLIGRHLKTPALLPAMYLLRLSNPFMVIRLKNLTLAKLYYNERILSISHEQEQDPDPFGLTAPSQRPLCSPAAGVSRQAASNHSFAIGVHLARRPPSTPEDLTGDIGRGV